jgi:hypothetical protein
VTLARGRRGSTPIERNTDRVSVTHRCFGRTLAAGRSRTVRLGISGDAVSERGDFNRIAKGTLPEEGTRVRQRRLAWSLDALD